MQSLDYFWLQNGRQIYIVRCHLETGEVVGRLSYTFCESGSILFSGRRYEKVGLERPTTPPGLKTICELPGDICLAVPETAVVGVLDPRKEFPRVREHISGRVANFLDRLLKDIDLTEMDVAVIGSRLFGGDVGSGISDIDVVIYGENHIDGIRNFVQDLLCRGIVTKLPLDQDRNDRARMGFFGISPSAMERIRAAQWFRRLLWSGLLVTLSFAPQDTYKTSFKLLGPEIEVRGRVVQNRDAYFPPFSYRIDPKFSTDVEWCASFAWCFRHAFAVGEWIATRGTIAEVNGKKCIWVWKGSHYLRPI